MWYEIRKNPKFTLFCNPKKKKKNNNNVRWHWVKCQLTFEPPLHLPNDRHKGNPNDSKFQN